jgi:hypothetical protein
MVAGGLLAVQAGAAGEAPRQAYDDRFTTAVPGAPAGRTYAIEWFDPSDPEGKPRSFSHLRVQLADGARFDTSAIPQCKATDAELMAAGASACPPDSRVATDETLLDTGVPGPGRYVTSDFVFFNNASELILLSTVRETGSRVVLRARVGTNTIDLDVPLLPGTPPDGAAAKRQLGRWDVRTTPRGAYLTTPPTCPASGFWLNRATYTYRDGVTQTAESRSPCRRAGPAASEPPATAPRQRAALRIGVAGVPRRCARRAFRARVRIAGARAPRSVRVSIDGRRIASARRARLTVRVPVARLARGRHVLRVHAVAAAGRVVTRRVAFRRC